MPMPMLKFDLALAWVIVTFVAGFTIGVVVTRVDQNLAYEQLSMATIQNQEAIERNNDAKAILERASDLARDARKYVNENCGIKY